MSNNTMVTVGERVELNRYTAEGRKRVIYGQRINGVVRLTDRPADGIGRSYLIERGLEQDGYTALMAHIADYLEQASELQQIPMGSSIVRVTQHADPA